MLSMAAVARHRSGPAPGWLAVMTTGASRASLESCAAFAEWAGRTGRACSVQASAAPRVGRAGRVCLVLCGERVIAGGPVAMPEVTERGNPFQHG